MGRAKSFSPVGKKGQSNIGYLFAEQMRQQTIEPNIYAYKPHKKQYLFHKSDKKLTLYIGGNRSGKTVGGACEMSYRLLGQNPYKKVRPAPIRARVHSVDFNYGCEQIIIPKMKQWLPPSALQNGSWEESYSKELRILTLANGSTLEFKSYDQDLDKFAGTSLHVNWYDEEPPSHIFNESQARLIDTNGDAFITMTPVEGMTWIYDDIYIPGKNGTREDVKVIEVEITENPHLDPMAILNYLNTLSPEERAARERGEFESIGGRIFKEFSRSKHTISSVVPEWDGELPPNDWAIYASIDHGLNNPTAILFHAVSPSGKIITFKEHYKSEWTVELHSSKYHEMVREIGREPLVVVGDPAMHQRSAITGTSIVQEYSDRGIYISTEKSDVSSGLNRMTRYLRRPDWQITDSCPKLIWEIEKYRWASHNSRKLQFQKNKQEVPHKKDDHAIDSTRYFFTLMPDPAPIVESTQQQFNKLKAATTSAVAGSWDELAGKLTPNEWNTTEGYEIDLDLSSYAE